MTPAVRRAYERLARGDNTRGQCHHRKRKGLLVPLVECSLPLRLTLAPPIGHNCCYRGYIHRVPPDTDGGCTRIVTCIKRRSTADTTEEGSHSRLVAADKPRGRSPAQEATRQSLPHLSKFTISPLSHIRPSSLYLHPTSVCVAEVARPAPYRDAQSPCPVHMASQTSRQHRESNS
ncbi:hypothetical protein BaRGS_00021866, partial [Batillaria attramentaria]